MLKVTHVNVVFDWLVRRSRLLLQSKWDLEGGGTISSRNKVPTRIVDVYNLPQECKKQIHTLLEWC